MMRWNVKRIFDCVAAATGLIVLSPLLAILWIATRIALGAPVIFKQERPGYRGKLFVLYKFRTMTNERDANGVLLPEKQRLTRFGRFIRTTSLDELPELYNVLIGEMSLVGPRPLLPEYLPYFDKEQERRHDVAPGITGWAQINGRNAISWDEKLRLDVWYVEHRSFWLDLKILFLTVFKVVQCGNVESKYGSFIDFIVQKQEMPVSKTLR